MKFIIISNKKNNLEKLIQQLNSKNIEIIYKNNELPYELLKKYGKDLKVIFFTNNLDKLLKVYNEQTLFDVLFINYNNLYNKFTIDMLNKYLDINLNSLIINDNNNIIDYNLLSKNKINYNVILCAVINNFESNINYISKFKQIKSIFKSCILIIYDSEGKSLQCEDVIILNDGSLKSNCAKNKILNYIEKKFFNIEYIIWFDEKILNFDYKNLYFPFQKTNWSMIGANTFIYEDLDNLRLLNKPYLKINTQFKILNCSKLLEVRSCFNHLGIYKYKHLKDCFFGKDGFINLHKEMKIKHNAKFYIHPKLLITNLKNDDNISDVTIQFDKLNLLNNYNYLFVIIVNNINKLNNIEKKIFNELLNLVKLYKFNVIKIDKVTNIIQITKNKILLNKIPIYISFIKNKSDDFKYLESIGNLFYFNKNVDLNFVINFIKNKTNIFKNYSKNNITIKNVLDGGRNNKSKVSDTKENNINITNVKKDNESKLSNTEEDNNLQINKCNKKLKIKLNSITNNVINLKKNFLINEKIDDQSNKLKNKITFYEKIINEKNDEIKNLKILNGNMSKKNNIKINNIKLLEKKVDTSLLDIDNYNTKLRNKSNFISNQKQTIEKLDKLLNDKIKTIINLRDKLKSNVNKPMNFKYFRINIAHIINPFKCKNNESYLYYAQPITFKSIYEAKKKTNIDVDIYATNFINDDDIIPEYFINLPNLTRSTLTEYPNIQNNKQLPFIQDIFDNLLNHSDADFLIYTNVDIIIHENFYTKINEILIRNNLDCLIINCKDVSKLNDDGEILNENDLQYIYNCKGEEHSGVNCFIIERSLLKKINMKNMFIGFPHWGFVLYELLKIHTKKILWLKDEFLTFHIGKDKPWDNKDDELYKQNINNIKDISNWNLLHLC